MGFWGDALVEVSPGDSFTVLVPSHWGQILSAGESGLSLCSQLLPQPLGAPPTPAQATLHVKAFPIPCTAGSGRSPCTTHPMPLPCPLTYGGTLSAAQARHLPLARAGQRTPCGPALHPPKNSQPTGNEWGTALHRVAAAVAQATGQRGGTSIGSPCSLRQSLPEHPSLTHNFKRTFSSIFKQAESTQIRSRRKRNIFARRAARAC